MRWLKHMTNSCMDEKLVMLRESHGLEGYGFFWLVMEQIGSKVDEKNTNFCTYPENFWRKILNLTPKKFEILLNFCVNLEIFQKKIDENDKNLLTIISPNILKYRDEYTTKENNKAKKLRSLSGVTPEQETETETETEEDLKEKEKAPPPKAAAPPPEENYPPDISEFVQEFQQKARDKGGNAAPRVTPGLIKQCCREVERIIRLDGFTLEQLKAACFWALDDDFWSGNVRSLAALRKQGKNGLKKIQNVVASWEQAKKGKTRASPPVKPDQLSQSYYDLNPVGNIPKPIVFERPPAEGKK